MVFDSVGFSLKTPEFQQIAMEFRKQSLLKLVSHIQTIADQ